MPVVKGDRINVFREKTSLSFFAATEVKKKREIKKCILSERRE